MSKCRVVLNRSGVRDLLKSQEMFDMIETRCDMIAAKAGSYGGEYEASTIAGKNRIQGLVTPLDVHSYYENMENNSLLKAMGEVKGI